MIEESYVSFETAKLLKEKGFDWNCHATYDTAVTGGKPKFSEYEVLNFFPYGMKNTDDKYGMVISAPTLQMAMKWLREKHGIFTIVQPNFQPDCIKFDAYILPYHPDKAPNAAISMGMCEDTYEAVCDAAIKYCLENLV